MRKKKSLCVFENGDVVLMSCTSETSGCGFGNG
jgi:hypothetical protein